MITVVEPPAILAIGVDTVKAHLQMGSLVNSQHDTLLELYIAAAIETFEIETSRALITQTVKQTESGFPCSSDFINLARSRATEVDSVKYYDTDNVLQTLDSDKYYLTTDTLPSKVYLNKDETWPDTYPRADAIEVIYVAGYGSQESDIPGKAKHAMCLMIGDSFLFKEDTLFAPGGTVLTITRNSSVLMNSFRTYYKEAR